MRLLDQAGAREVKIFTRRVRDGELRSIVSCDPPDYRWNLTITHTGRKERYPTWEELTHARYELLPGKLCMALYLPSIEDAVGPPTASTLHLIETKTADD